MTGDAARQTEMAHTSMPFTAELELTVTSVDASAVVGRAEWTPERCTAGGVLHGGYLMAVADSIGALCAFFNLPQGSSTGTIESKTNFFRAVRGGGIEVTATPVHVGRSTIVVQTDIVDGDGRLVTRTMQTQAVLGRSAQNAE